MEKGAVTRVHCLLFLLSVSSLTASHLCHHRQYWHAASKTCRPCTECPRNEIIRKPCGRQADTECGPFSEFSFFNQLEGSDAQLASYEHGSFSHENTTVVDQTKDVWKARGQQTEPIVEKDDGEYWKNLAFALIGVVCVLIMVATIVVFIACKKLHESVAVKSQEEEDDDDSGYVVVVHRPHPPPGASSTSSAPPPPAATAAALLLPNTTNDRLRETHTPPHQEELCVKGTYKPRRRLLDYDADDVFESEDSSGSRSSRRAPLLPIPEMSVSSDCEHGGRGAGDM